MSTPADPSRWPRWLAAGLIALALGVAVRGLDRRTTWYLASDQFAFLTFAADLRAGTVFHDPSALRLLRPRLWPTEAADAFFQTYILHGDRLYSRYPPGYPLLLAAAGALGGERAEHALNPVLYLLMLALVAWLAADVVGRAAPRARLAAAATVPWLLLTLPAEVHYWGVTVARDLPAHLLGVAALIAAGRGRFPLAAFLVGVAASIRPDVALYGLSLGALALVDRVGIGRALASAIAFVVGALPLFAYNTATSGHPLHFPQGVEFRNVLGAVQAAPRLVLASAMDSLLVQGGAFRLAHLARTLPGHASYFATAFGAFLVPAAGALVWSLFRAPRMAALLVPYGGAAFVFYSCWSHPDPRYLVGVALGVAVLAAAGCTLWVAWLAGERRPWTRIAGAALTAAVALAAPLVFHRPAASRLPAVERSVAAAAVVAAVAAAVAGPGPGIARLGALAPAVALAGVAAFRVATATAPRDPMQGARVARARAALGSLVPPGALVLTTSALGRPAENITHYIGAFAVYLPELRSLRAPPERAAISYLSAGRRVFLLSGAGDRPPFSAEARLQVREVARRRGPALYDWFVDPRMARQGAALSEVTLAGMHGRP